MLEFHSKSINKMLEQNCIYSSNPYVQAGAVSKSNTH